MCEIVNREQRKTRKINEGIKREKWEKYFRKLLGEVERKVVKGEKGEKRGEDNERELSRREIKVAIGKLKDKKRRIGGRRNTWGGTEGRR